MTGHERKPTQGRPVHENAGIGQERVGEPGPAPDQTGLPPAAGGKGSGSGDAPSGPSTPR